MKSRLKVEAFLVTSHWQKKSYVFVRRILSEELKSRQTNQKKNKTKQNKTKRKEQQRKQVKPGKNSLIVSFAARSARSTPI